MDQQPNIRVITSLKLFSTAGIVVVVLLGCFVLLGWSFDVAALKNVLPVWVSMKANTALGFVLAGVTLWLLRSDRRTQPALRIAQVCAVIVCLLGILTLSEYLFRWNIGIDQLLFSEPAGTVGTFSPGRMAPNTALGFAMLGFALLLIDVETRKGRRPAQHIALLAALIGFLSLIGYMYGVSSFYGMAHYTKMAVHTAAGFTLLSIAFMFVRPTRGLMAVVTSDSAGGIMARRMSVAAVVILVAIGWLRLAGERAGLYSGDLGVSLTVVVSIVLFLTLIWITAGSLQRVDIQRKRAEEDLERFFALSPDLMCVAGFDGYFKRLNPSWERTLGFKSEELLARPYVEFVHPDDRNATTEEAESISGGTSTILFENRYVCKDGAHRWLSWTATPLVHQQLIYATARDITDRRLAEDRIRQLNDELKRHSAALEAANKELEAFSYSVSHDLRAPLRSIDGFSLALLEDFSEKLDVTGKDFLARIRASCQHMGHLIDDMLKLARVTRAEMHRQTVDLSTLAGKIANQLHSNQPERQVKFLIAPNMFVQGDGRLLEVALENLLANAWKFTCRRGQAVIEFGRTERNGMSVYFVRDDGIGFEMEYADKLFAPFQRLHSPSEFPGTGVGLATVQRVVHRHGGQIWAEGRMDRGATFYFTL